MVGFSQLHLCIFHHFTCRHAGMGQKQDATTPLLSGSRSHAPTAPDSLPPPADNPYRPAEPSSTYLYEHAAPSAPVMTSMPQGYSQHTAYTVSPAQEGQPPVVHVYPLGANPERMMCPRCGSQGLSSTDKEIGMSTWLCSFMLCFLGCCWISWIPFCLNAARDIVHRCPSCGTVLGRIRP